VVFAEEGSHAREEDVVVELRFRHLDPHARDDAAIVVALHVGRVVGACALKSALRLGADLVLEALVEPDPTLLDAFEGEGPRPLEYPDIDPT
jgi:hypothetical protein